MYAAPDQVPYQLFVMVIITSVLVLRPWWPLMSLGLGGGKLLELLSVTIRGSPEIPAIDLVYVSLIIVGIFPFRTPNIISALIRCVSFLLLRFPFNVLAHGCCRHTLMFFMVVSW